MNEKRRVESLRDIRAFLRAALTETALCDNPKIWTSIVRALDFTMDELLALETADRRESSEDPSIESLELLIAKSLMMADHLECKHAAAALNSALLCVSGRGIPPSTALLE